MGKSLIIKGADFSANGIAPEFQKLKCIVSTSGTQSMRSPVDMPAIGRVVAEVAVSNNTTTGVILGFMSNRTLHPEENMQLSAIYNVSAYFSGGFGIIGNINRGAAQEVTNVINDLNKHTIDFSRYVLKVDGQSKSIAAGATTESSVKFGIFGAASYLKESDDGVLVGAKLYSIKMYSDYQNNDSLILDAIPVKRLSDNKICLYDKISGEYIYTRDGTNPNYEELN